MGLSTIKSEIKFTGYNDANFFDNVYKNPKSRSCQSCGCKFAYQWTRNGVEVYL